MDFDEHNIILLCDVFSIIIIVIINYLTSAETVFEYNIIICIRKIRRIEY